MIKRWIAIFVVGAGLFVAPAQSHAQVADAILKCAQSWKIAVVCVVVERGVEKVVEVGLDALVALASGRKTELTAPDMRPSEAMAADVQANGIEWSKLKEFLLSVFSSAPPADEVQVREKVAKSCRTNFVPVCRYLGIPEPRQVVDCSSIMTKADCDVRIACSWKDASCTKGVGARELLNR